MVKLNKIGVQLYTIRDQFKDPESAKVCFEKLKKLGYDEVQTAGCAANITPEIFGKLAREAGLTVVGTHDDFNLMVNDPERAMDNHDLMGTKIMGIGGFFHTDKEAYDDFIAKANTVARNIKARGFKFTYHNHSHEFRKIDGKLIMDYLLENLDPDNTGFVLDTYWVQHGGGDVRYWIEKLKGRVDTSCTSKIWRRATREKRRSSSPRSVTATFTGRASWKPHSNAVSSTSSLSRIPAPAIRSTA